MSTNSAVKTHAEKSPTIGKHRHSTFNRQGSQVHEIISQAAQNSNALLHHTSSNEYEFNHPPEQIQRMCDECEEELQSKKENEHDQPYDRYEQQADSVADLIVGNVPIANASLGIQRVCDDCEDELQTKLDIPIGSPEDAFEQEADLMADKVVNNENISDYSISDGGIQRLCDECEDELQLKADEDLEDELQQKSNNKKSAVDKNQNVSHSIRQLLHQGSPLPATQRQFYEQRMGRDFSNVRIHTNESASATAKAIGARAFTYKNHLVFAKGEYQPLTQKGKHLLAHELTHVIQQGAAQAFSQQQNSAIGLLHQSAIQKVDDDNGDDTPEEIPAVAGNKNTGLVDRTNPSSATITWSRLNVPRFKNRDHRKTRYDAVKAEGQLKRGKGPRVDRQGDNDPRQRDKWLRELSSSTIREKLVEKIRTANAGEMPEGDRFVFEVRSGTRSNRYYSDTLDNLAREFLIPTWGGTGRTSAPRFYHVDHIVELQLANWPHSNIGNEMANMELLQGHANMESGRIVRDNIVDKIEAFIAATDNNYGSTVEEIKTNYTLVFESVVGSGGPSVRREDYWKQSEIVAGDHLNSVAGADPTAIGGPGLVRVFSRPSGGVSRRFVWSGNTTEEQAITNASERDWLKPYVITHKYFKTDPESETTGDDFGYLKIHVPEGHKVFNSTEPVDFALNRFVGARYGGALPESSKQRFKNNLVAKHFSPVVMDDLQVLGDRGLVSEGYIDVSLPFFNNSTQIGLRLGDQDLSIFKEFTVDDIELPQPFEKGDCSLTIAYGLSSGWSANGNFNFGIENVGSGQISVGVHQETGFSASGSFDFDSTLFNPANLTVRYENDNWSFSGTVGIQEGIIPGVSSAELTVGWEDNVLSGSGDIAFTFPWLNNGTLTFRQSPEEGFSLGATVGLTGEIPGLRSGEVAVNIDRNNEGVWNLGGSITANLNTERVPGLTSTVLSGTINNGIFDASINSEFERDIASGRVTVGVTNQSLDENGDPVEGVINDELIFYGSGNVAFQLTPWLEANAGVAFDRDGSISVEGGIEVTEDIEILSDEQTPDFEIPRARRPGFDVNIPLASVGVADVALDLAGEVNAYLRTSPLVLTDVGLNAFYEFDNPQSARVEGNARLHMDAQAGIAGALEVGLSARVLVLRGGGRINLTVGAELGGDLDLTVQPAWNLQDGFSVDAELSIIVQPVVFASLSGYLYAEIDAFIGSIEVWESERLSLADTRMPLDIQVGATADAHYQEKPRSELTYSGINWVYPTAAQMQDAFVNFVKNEV